MRKNAENRQNFHLSPENQKYHIYIHYNTVIIRLIINFSSLVVVGLHECSTLANSVKSTAL